MINIRRLNLQSQVQTEIACNQGDFIAKCRYGVIYGEILEIVDQFRGLKLVMNRVVYRIYLINGLD